MILSEFERNEGYDSELGWQTKSRLDILSAKGGHTEHENGVLNGHRSTYPGVKKGEKQLSLLPAQVEMSHYQNGDVR